MTLWEFFRMGGIVMWPLLFFSIATAAIILERIIFLCYHSLKIDSLKEMLANAIDSGDLTEAKASLQNHARRSVAASVLLTLVNCPAPPSRRRLEKTAEAEAAARLASVESGLTLLTTLASLSPLTGFLGTVTGMIAAFRSIAEAADVNAQIVAAGIYEALITTVFGLGIAIAAMSAHAVFSGIADRFASNLEIACSQLINKMCEDKRENMPEKTPEIAPDED